MQDGDFVYYTIQHRITHKSPWCMPYGQLKYVPDSKWCFSCWDKFGRTFEPWHDDNKHHSHKLAESYKDKGDVFQKTGENGWFNLKHAVLGLKRARDANLTGKFDSFDSYGKRCQAVRYEFRIVKMTVSQKTEVISNDDLINIIEI